ncbi:multiple organellar RNA editing factor 1, mitochondrial isoform X2 [Manihot esculenta]|uniref:MORF/ORRM1/DAG-like MORF domain-containing protein n=1 Tax=Manihot esculenta TaxID=3983 RepID=A0A2C9V5T9_MANES|nr:multiple organellar RNA editing factor 1, mitochondrial isoform X3 [Manihot esculenta]XP_021626272.1 multiple organellar RNA editing factor 1, mitochondrial isoform X2 [Manihot esculenta]OAY39806.1 hypothetical protein MANES_10G123400v8 [Manihot esculenta]
MALQFVRFRRALTSLSTLQRSLSSPIIPTCPLPLPHAFISPSPSKQSPAFFIFQSRPFAGSPMSLSSSGKQYRVYKEGDEITEDMVLFEGCDFNHWLITVDFPKDPKPTPEEMVATYERICAQGLGISIEEAKKKIYACSTTTYQGFQAVMTEEESEKFKDIPGVVFVLPDSYIDPQNKEYGGDKYENGVITPRPPPVQYRKTGRFNDRNRNPAQPRYDQQGGPAQPRYDQQGGPAPNQRGSPQYNQQGYMQGGRASPQFNQGYTQGGGNYGPPQNYPPQQNYGPPGQGDRMPMNNWDKAPGGRDSYQTNRGPYQGSYGQDQRGGQYQGNYSHGQQGNHYPQDQRGFPQGDQRNFRGDGRNFSPAQPGTHGQGSNIGYGQGYPGEGQRFSQMEQRNMHGEQSNYAPVGQTGENQGRY